jgi:hypothetical protein
MLEIYKLIKIVSLLKNIQNRIQEVLNIAKSDQLYNEIFFIY